MTNHKNRFFTLLFSCCPGAGEMYMGLYRHGVSLMVLFFGGIAAGFWLGWEELLLLICPVVWCYSFFHTHNLRRMTEEAFAEVEDTFFFEGYIDYAPDWQGMKQYRHLFGILLLLFAVSNFAKILMRLFGTFYYLPEIIWQLTNSLPQIVVAFMVLYAGVRLMREPKEADESEEMETEEIETEKIETEKIETEEKAV